MESRVFFFRDKIERDLAKSISYFGEKTKLRDACEYAITNGGKRFRPLIVHLIADALGNDLDITEAALSVEFFHTASLIADDLPCMDNDDQRRELPTVHKIYGESIALLATYSLVTAAFAKIHESSLVMKRYEDYACMADKACASALERASFCSGIHGATGGQFLDLFPAKPNIDSVKDVIYKKTVTLFEVAFTFGWVFGGGDTDLLPKVKKASEHFGMAFQIADDISDLTSDIKNNKEVNIARLIGKTMATEMLGNEVDGFKETLAELNILNSSFEKLCTILLTKQQ